VLPRSADSPAGAGGAIDHIAFDAEDLPAFQQRLEALGQSFEGRRLADGDTWQVFLTDPDGVHVELSSQMPAR
jgi:catechol 2,3-dioxygenase-like lactoylglutathione lyase family enzyme